MFKKMLTAGFLSLAAITLLAGCGNDSSNNTSGENTDGSTSIDTIKIGFVPSRDADEIVTATEPLKDLLISQLATQGYEVGNVEISVGTNYEAVGESLSSGTLDIGFIPGGTYALYDDGAEVILTSTRAGLSNDSDDPKDWNENKPTDNIDEQAAYYRSLIIAGPSEKGQELAEKVNAGEELTWEDLNSASWAISTSSSSAGYIYPTLWLNENYDKTLLDLDSAVQSDSYASSYARLGAGQIDLLVSYADARMDYVDNWTTEFGRSESIWDETNVIGVTQPIYNDTISVSSQSDIMTDDLKAALADAFIAIAETDEGKEVISIYNHDGYTKAQSSDYDNERNAQKLIRELGQ